MMKFFLIQIFLFLLCCNKVLLIKQLQFTKKHMHFQEFTLRPNKNIIRHISHNQSPNHKQLNSLDYHQRFSEHQNKTNFIKINKNKLPNDFFQKKQNRRVSQQKIYFPQQFTEPILHARRIESQRLINSPEKTTFFGFLQEKEFEHNQKLNFQPSKILNRKFETRQQPKRDAFQIQIPRKIAGTSNTSKRDLLNLFPSTFDNQMNDIITESSRSHIQKITPKKQTLFIQKQAQLFINPEKQEHTNNFIYPSARKHKQMVMKFANMSIMDSQNNQEMNITFYNAKSNCFPPISRQNS